MATDGIATLTERDVEILRFAVRHGMVSPGQVATRLCTTTAMAGRRLRALEVAGLLRRDRVLTGSPAIVRATAAGARRAGCDLPPASLDLARVRHSLALVDLSEELLAAHPGSTWTAERELRRDRMRAARAGQMWQRRRRVPDGLLHLDGGLRVAVELDLTPKRSARLDTLAGAYAVDREVDTVWWYLPSDTAASRMRALVAERGLEHLIEPRVRRVGRTP
jgi:DNA-binding MarR family transcriptional regulator